MRRIVLALMTVALLTASCRRQGSGESFGIEGSLSGAAGEMLYLDHVGLDGINVIDSVKLDAEGSFSFRQPRPECYDFYRLRVGDRFITLSIDSTETVTVKAEKTTMMTGYEVSGSENCAKLKSLILSQAALQREINAMASQPGIESGVLAQRINEKVEVFKSDINNGYIFTGTDKPYAYYALFMRVNGTPLYFPQQSRQDAKCYASVATMMDLKYPDAVRVRNLHNIALKAMKATAAPAPVSDETSAKLNSLVSESGVIEIALPDAQGVVHKLTDLKGKVVLLDFTAFKTDYSADYILQLRELYNKYAAQGFEIYQVSVDQDSHFWATSSDNLPWVCVYDESSLNSQYLQSYRVEILPTAFLINKDNEITERVQSFKDLDGSIADLLGAN